MLSKFGCHGNSLNCLENSGSKFEFAKPLKSHYTGKKFRDFWQEIEICAILAFLSNFGCHGNPLGSLAIQDSIFEVADTTAVRHKTRL